MSKTEFDKLLLINNFTRSEMAEKLGVTTGIISLWISNKRFPSFKNLISMSNILGVKVDEIVNSLRREQ